MESDWVDACANSVNLNNVWDNIAMLRGTAPLRSAIGIPQIEPETNPEIESMLPIFNQ